MRKFKKSVGVLCSIALLATMSVSAFADVTITQGDENNSFSVSFDDAMADDVIAELEQRGIEVIKDGDNYRVTDSSINIGDVVTQIIEDKIDNTEAPNNTANNTGGSNSNGFDYNYKVDSKFNDVSENDWFYEAVAKCEDLGLVGGYGDGNFGPNDPVTMQQICLINLRFILLHNEGTSEKEGVTYPYVGDFANQFEAPIQSAKDLKIIANQFTTNETTRFVAYRDYAQPAYREEALSCFYRSYNFTTFNEWVKDFDGKRGFNRPYIENPNIPDYSDISDVFKSDIYEAYKLGFATGYDETGAFKPKNEITRAEYCQMIYNSGIVEMLHYRLNGSL